MFSPSWGLGETGMGSSVTSYFNNDCSPCILCLQHLRAAGRSSNHPLVIHQLQNSARDGLLWAIDGLAFRFRHIHARMRVALALVILVNLESLGWRGLEGEAEKGGLLNMCKEVHLAGS